MCFKLRKDICKFWRGGWREKDTGEKTKESHREKKTKIERINTNGYLQGIACSIWLERKMRTGT